MKRLLLLLAAVVMVASACGSSSASKDLEHVKVMLDWTPNTNHTGMYVAKERGYYKDQGLNVEFIQPGEQGGLSNLASGTVDFAVDFQESLIPARAEGLPVVSIGALLTTNTSSLLSLKSDNITRPKDLEGKTSAGDSELAKAIFSTLVKCDGGDPSKIKWANVGTTEYRVGLERNDFDFFWAFDGWQTIDFRQKNVEFNTIAFRDYMNCIPNWYTPLLATSEKTIKEDSDKVKKFLDATARGYRDAVTDPRAGADDLLKAAPELDSNLVYASAEFLASFYAEPGEPWGVHKPDVWNRFNDFLHAEGIVKEKVDANASFTNEFLPSDKSPTRS